MPESLRLSWSRLRLHSECPEKGKHIAAGRKSKVADSRVFFPGTVCDILERQWLAQEKPEPGWMRANVDAVMTANEKGREGDGPVKWKDSGDRARVRAFCQEAVWQLEEDLAVEALPHDWDPAVRFEVPLMIPGLYGPDRVQIMLVGEIDLLVRRPDGIVVWDLKATKDNNYWRKVLGQLLFYEIAVWGMTGTWPVYSGLLQPMCNETTPRWCFTQDQRVQMFGRITSVAHDIMAGRLDPKPGAQCRYCDVRHACSVKGGGRGRVQGWPG